MLFKGSGVALVTPFNKDESINFDKLEELINLHIENNTDALIICATTGEGTTLDIDEYEKMIKFCVKKVSKKIPVIVGSGSNNTKIAIEKSKLAQNLGADGVLVVTPYYNKCNMDGMYLHYKKINDSIDIPIIIYNVPSRTGVDISVNTITKLSKLKNICGIKEASNDISKIANEIKELPKTFHVYSGNDDLILPTLSLGGSGVISVFANVYPKEMHDICEYYFKGDLFSASKLYYHYLDFMEKLFIDINPIPVKMAMNTLGYNVGSCRLPLSNLDTKKIKILTDAILNLKTK